MKRKYWYSDLDNTLNRKECGTEYLSTKVISTIKKFRRLGGSFGVATTRGLLRTKEVIGNLSNLPLIVLNGAEVYDNDGVNQLSLPLHSDELEAAIHSIKMYADDIDFCAFYKSKNVFGNVYTSTSTKAAQIREKYPKTFQNPKTDVTTSLLAFTRHIKASSVAMIELQFKEGIKPQFPVCLQVSSDGIYYITSKGVNKGFTLEIVSKLIGISPLKLIISGDATTDATMMQNEDVLSVGVGKTIEHVIQRVGSPEELATYINGISIMQK